MKPEFTQHLREAEIRVQPIGIVHSPFSKPGSAPPQPVLAHGEEGIVEVFPEYEAGLEDLEGFERIWLICWFHKTGQPKLRIIPRQESRMRGLFATRSPNRPNPIGISPVRLLDVEGNRLRVADLDILDGTPLLDIKPYSPKCDSFPDSEAGWLDRPGRF